MSYVSEIRKKIGHDPLMIVGASVIVTDEKGRVLLQHRADNGQWGYHGGCVELGENTEAAARREMLEETGLTAGKMTLLGVFSGPEMRYTYPNGDQASIVDIVYLCSDYSGEIRPQLEEVTELRWFDPADIPADDQLSPPNIPALRLWQSSRREPSPV